MNGFPNRQIFPVTMASNARTAVVDLGGNSWKKVFFDARELSGDIAVSVSTDGVTFGALNERVPTSTVQFQAVTFPTALSGAWLPLELNAQYVQFVATATAAGGSTNYLICID